MDGRVAIVIITHNRRDELLRTLTHLRRLEEQPHIVVVDNGSTDGTTAAVAEQFPAVDVVSSSRNLGAAGRNLGVRAVNTPFVAFCDDDTWWRSGALNRAADLFEACPRLAVLTARVLVGPERKEDPACVEMERSPLPAEPGMPGYPLLGFLAGASMVRREAFLSAGGFEPRIGLGGEEEWLAAALAAGGWWLCYVPDIIVHHYPSSRRDNCTRQWQSFRNALWFTWRHRPALTALWRTIRIAASTSGGWTRMRGLAAALGGASWAIRNRHVLPPHIEHGLCILEKAKKRKSQGD